MNQVIDKSMLNNLIFRADGYKLSHYLQLPPNTTKAFHYVTSRGGKFKNVVPFGAQYYMKEYFTTPVSKEDVDQAVEMFGTYGPKFNEAGWRHIVNKHGGFLPLKIRAVPEGTVIPVQNVLMSVETTDPECYWLAAYMETLLLKIWYPTTVATTSHAIKGIIRNFLKETAESLEGLEFKLHDFGYRGVSSEESAGIGGSAHAINFLGSDTVRVIPFLRAYYGAEMPIHSINASEHFSITAWGRDNEFKAYENMEEVYKDCPMFACVGDSYNVFEGIKLWGKLKDRLKKNETTLVFRPDSGDPLEVSIQCMKLLEEEFGSTRNGRGYKVLDGVRLIYGDGIKDETVIFDILKSLKDNQFSAENIAFGMGGGLLQKCDRDTQEFAMKCSAVISDGSYVPVSKDPIHSSSNKKSRAGFLDLIRRNGEFVTVDSPVPGEQFGSCMKTIYEDGVLKNETTLAEIRERLSEWKD